MLDTITLPTADIRLGDSTEFEGKTLTATKKFTQGKDAAASGLKYFMHTTNHEVLGFEQV